MHPRYEEWLDFAFDHEVAEPAWYWDIDYPMFEAGEEDYAMLIENTFSHAGRDLARFSDAQVNQGVNFLVSIPCSNYLFALKDTTVPLEIRLRAIRSIFTLYRDCFQSRCTETLSHLGQRPRSDLNYVCYMFWDISSLGCFERTDAPDALADCVFEVLADTLSLDHLACKEAAIHGYGEFWCEYPERVKKAIDEFLLTDIPSTDLRIYAECARSGNIQ
jgi:hypothetical protein